jgi:hypothetical protein
MTTTTNGTTTNGTKALDAPRVRGIGLLPCPLCGEQQATIDLCLADFNLHCQDCDSDLTVAEVEAFIAKWQRVLSWLALAVPAQEGGRS